MFEVYYDWLDRVNWHDPKGVVTPVVQETPSVMACLTHSKTMAPENVSNGNCNRYTYSVQ